MERGIPTISGTDDLVGETVLQHPVLVDPGFVRERIPAHDGLVRLGERSGQVGQQLTGTVDLA